MRPVIDDVHGDELPAETQSELAKQPARFRPRWTRNYWNCPHEERRLLYADSEICAYCGEILPIKAS